MSRFREERRFDTWGKAAPTAPDHHRDLLRRPVCKGPMASEPAAGRMPPGRQVYRRQGKLVNRGVELTPLARVVPEHIEKGGTPHLRVVATVVEAWADGRIIDWSGIPASLDSSDLVRPGEPDYRHGIESRAPTTTHRGEAQR